MRPPVFGLSLCLFAALSFLAAPCAAAPDAAVAPDVETLRIDVSYPAIPFSRLQALDPNVAATVEERIRNLALDMVRDLLPFGTVTGTYSVDFDRDGLLCITLLYSGYRPPMAHPMHVQRSLTFDLATGKELQLNDLFADASYLDLLTAYVAEAVDREGIPLLRPLGRLQPNQDFRLTPAGIAIYFQLYDLAPYAWGFPEFLIPYEAVSGLLDARYAARLLPGN